MTETFAGLYKNLKFSKRKISLALPDPNLSIRYGSIN